MTSFALRSARSAAVTVTIGFVLAIETVAIHSLLAPRHAVVAWSVTLLSIATLAWLMADYVALGSSAVHVDETTVRVSVGRRLSAIVPRTAIQDVRVATWRDVPDRADGSWLNATKPADPNVVVTFDPPTPVHLFGIAARRIRRLGLHADDPVALRDALQVDAAPTAITDARRFAERGAR